MKKHLQPSPLEFQRNCISDYAEHVTTCTFVYNKYSRNHKYREWFDLRKFGKLHLFRRIFRQSHKDFPPQSPRTKNQLHSHQFPDSNGGKSKSYGQMSCTIRNASYWMGRRPLINSGRPEAISDVTEQKI